MELPPDFLAELGFIAGGEVHVEISVEGICLSRPLGSLGKIYIEPTNQCNLSCRTCIRNAWEGVPTGFRDSEVFQRAVQGISRLSNPPLVFFGGYGEPLLHPEILQMVRSAKAAGSRVELITNGTLLDEAMSLGLARAGLDRLWVSLDGATSEGYGSLRPATPLHVVVENLYRFNRRATGPRPFVLPRPALGVVFGATRRNLQELPQVVSL